MEDVQQAVLGAGLEAMQLSRGRVGGSLAFANDGAVAVSSGYVNGRVCLNGLLSDRMTTLGLGIQLPQGSRQWLREVTNGDIGIFRPGDEHEALYAPGSIYLAVTLPDEVLEERAAESDLVLDRQQLGASRICQTPMARDKLLVLQERVRRIHLGTDLAGASALCRLALEYLIESIAREARVATTCWRSELHRHVVARAKEFILEHLDEPLSISAVAKASRTSRSALYRAFQNVLEEPPQLYIRKLRLHRIRRDLAGDAEARCTVALMANRWGISELGRFAGWYRELFGERPSDTHAHRDAIAPKASASLWDDLHRPH